MFKPTRLVLACASFVALLAWSSSASAQEFISTIDPILDGNVSDVDYAFPERPLTLTQGSFEASAHLGHVRRDFGSFDFNSTGLQLNGSFGITEQIEAGLSTFLFFDPDFEWNEVLAPRGVFSLLQAGDGSVIDMAIDAQLVLNFGDGDLLPFAIVGAPVRFKINEQLYLLAGQNVIALGIEADILDIAANTTLVWVATDALVFRFDTQLFNLRLRDGDSTLIFADITPLGITGLYNIVTGLDVTASLAFEDLFEGADFLTFTAGVLSRF